MNGLANVLAVIAIAAGSSFPTMGHQFPREMALLVVMLLSLGSALALAAHWWKLVQVREGQLAAAPDPGPAIQSLMREGSRWLQPFRPGFAQLRPTPSSNALRERLASGCLGPMVIGVAVLALAIAVMVFLDDAMGRRGFFGQFLQTVPGRAAAGAFSAYLLISSTAPILLGLMARLHRGTTE